MPDTIIQDVVTTFRKEGPIGLSRRLFQFLIGQVFWSRVTNTELTLLDSAAKISTVHEADEKSITYSGRHVDLPYYHEQIDGIVETPDVLVAEFSDATIIGSEFVLRIENEYTVPRAFDPQCFDDACQIGPNVIRRMSTQDVLQERIIKTKSRKLDSAFVLGNPGRAINCFGHWFDEMLVKLHWYELYREQTGEDPPLILPAGLADWQVASLELLGYPRISWIEQGDEITRVKKLLVPPHYVRTSGSGYLTPASSLRWVGERIRSNVATGGNEGPRRIFVSREGWPKRLVRNEDEVMTMLNEYGFECVHPGRLPFEEQVHLFADADVVITPHCSAMIHMLWTENATIVELASGEDHIDADAPHFFVLANELGLSYEFLPCGYVEDSHPRPFHRDLIVDVDELEQLVIDLCQ